MIPAISFPSSMFKTTSDVKNATIPALRAYLTAEKVPFGETAERPELEALAREHVILRNTKNPPAPENPQTDTPKDDAPLPIDASPDEALRVLQSKGFEDAPALIAYLGVLEREKADIARERSALQATIDDISARESNMKTREEALEARAAEVRADVEKQTTIYEKIEAIKRSLPADTPLNI